MSLRREITPEPGTLTFPASTSGLPDSGDSSVLTDRSSNIDHLPAQLRTPSSQGSDQVPTSSNSDDSLMNLNPQPPSVSSLSPEPHEIQLPPPPSQQPQSTPSRVRRPDRFSDPATELSPSERVRRTRLTRDYGSSGISVRSYDSPGIVRPTRTENTHHRSSRFSPYDPRVSTTGHGQSSEPTRLTLPDLSRRHGTSPSSSHIPQPDHDLSVSDNFPLRLAPMNIPSSVPTLALTSDTTTSHFPPRAPIIPLQPRQRELTKVCALAVREGDILKYGNIINDGFTVTACYPAEPPFGEDTLPVRLNAPVRIQWFDPTLGIERYSLFGGMEQLEVLRVVDDEIRLGSFRRER
ncbi:hypothetical protein N7G274_008027 [Stereocaulon virgatum]|uniref:Uncharacterized protein n=1 Tax=Stereocaulon virgatum TaxID=373712 RepID=A0ABR4A096_9LECA